MVAVSPSKSLRRVLDRAYALAANHVTITTSSTSATARPHETQTAPQVDLKAVQIHSLLTDRSETDKANREELRPLTPIPPPPLHMSLSRPLILQTNQRSELRAGLADIAAQATW